MAFLTSQSWRVLKSWYTGGGSEQGFRRSFADGLNQSLVSSVAQIIGHFRIPKTLFFKTRLSANIFFL